MSFLVKCITIILLLSILRLTLVEAGQKSNAFTGKPDFCSTVTEEDGSPSATACQTLEVTNGTLVDDGDGAFSLSTGGGGGNSFETIAVPAGASVVADSSTDTLTLTETSFLTLTGTAATDTIDITQVTTDLGTDGLIAANAVALGTDTTNAYVATVADAGNATITVVGSGSETAAVTLDAVDLNCTDCIGTTEIADSYVLNTGDTMTGDLSLTGTGPDVTMTPTSGDAAGMHAELFGASDTDYFIKNDTRFVLEEWPNGLVLGGNSSVASAARVWIKSTTTGNDGLRLQEDSIGVLELDTADDPANNEVLTYQASSGRMVWGSGGSTNSFETIAVSGQSDVVADSATDTLTLTAGTNITITTNAGTDAVTINSTGGGTGDVTIEDGTPSITTTDTTAGDDDWHLDFSDDQVRLVNTTSGNEVLTVRANASPSNYAADSVVNLRGWKDQKCGFYTDLVAGDDNLLIFDPIRPITVTDVACKTSGFTTQPTLSFEDDSGNAMTGAPVCDASGQWQPISAGGALGTNEGLRFDTTNTPAPTSATQVLVCFAYTMDYLP